MDPNFYIFSLVFPTVTAHDTSLPFTGLFQVSYRSQDHPCCMKLICILQVCSSGLDWAASSPPSIIPLARVSRQPLPLALLAGSCWWPHSISVSTFSNTVGLRHNGNGYKIYPEITVKLYSPNYILAFKFYLFITLGDPDIRDRFFRSQCNGTVISRSYSSFRICYSLFLS